MLEILSSSHSPQISSIPLSLTRTVSSLRPNSTKLTLTAVSKKPALPHSRVPILDEYIKLAIGVGLELTIDVPNVVVEIDGRADPIAVFIEALRL